MSKSFSFSALSFSSFRFRAKAERPVGWVLSALLIGILWFGAVPLAAQPNELNTDQERLKKMLNRNGDLMPAVDVAAEDGFFRATVAAELTGPVESLGEAYRVLFRFNEEEQGLGKCFVFRDRTDLASPLVQFSEQYFANFAQTFGLVESKRIWAIDAGHIEGSPYLGLEWFYYGGNEKTVAGHLKSWIAVKEERGIYCQGDLLGHSQTFFDLFAGFVESLEFKESAARQPHFEEVALVRARGQNFGIQTRLYSVDADGDVESLETVSLLGTVGQSEPLAMDTTWLAYSNLTGDLIAESYLELVKGETQTLLHLAPSEEGMWSISGLARGEELNVELGEGRPRSGFGQRQDFVGFMQAAKPGAVLEHQVWAPSVDPTRWVNQELTYKGSHEDGAAIVVQAGSKKLEGVVDENLSFEIVSRNFGAGSISFEKIFERGDVWFPRTLIDSAPPDSKSPIEASDAVPEEARELASSPRP